MECQYPGLWHLGLSSQACENAGGRWFRSPCFLLQKCINDRAKKGDPGYSQSFEDFSVGLVINDPYDEEQCQNTRQGLGFAPDYEFDVDGKWFHLCVCSKVKYIIHLILFLRSL